METYYRINIINHVNKNCPDEALKKIAEKTLQMEGIKDDVELNLLFTDDKEIKNLNQKFLNRAEPTDVISFSAKKPLAFKKNLKGFIGEIAISVETARYNAKRFKTTREREIFLYIIHGILHLLGYKDKTKKEKRIIGNRQNKILDEICRPNL